MPFNIRIRPYTDADMEKADEVSIEDPGDTETEEAFFCYTEEKLVKELKAGTQKNSVPPPSDQGGVATEERGAKVYICFAAPSCGKHYAVLEFRFVNLIILITLESS